MKRFAIFLVVFAILPSACKPPAARVATTQPAPIPPEEPNLRGLHAFIEKAIARANKRAAALDGKTYIEHCSFDRTIYFVPMPVPPKPEPAKVEIIDGKTVIVVPRRKPPPPIEIPDIPLSDGPEPPPKDAVAKRWTDSYALAQQFSYRYSLEHAGPIVKGKSMLNSKVRIKVTAKRRTAIAANEKPIPQPPDGMMVWHPSKFESFSRFFASGGPGRELMDIEMSKEARRNVKGTLAEEAAKKMLSRPKEVLTRTINLDALYWPKARLWFISGVCTGNEPPKPVRLWKKGVPRGRCVRSQPTTRPAD